MKRWRNSILFGVACSIIGTLIGTLLYYLFMRHLSAPLGHLLNDISMSLGDRKLVPARGISGSLGMFIRNAYLSDSLHMVLRIGAMFNLVTFFIFMRKKWYRPGYGVIYTTIVLFVLLTVMALV